MTELEKSNTTISITQVRETGRQETRDIVAMEEPLEIRLGYTDPLKGRVHRSISITMRTPGDDINLACGFLYSESIISSIDEEAILGMPFLIANQCTMNFGQPTLQLANREIICTNQEGRCVERQATPAAESWPPSLARGAIPGARCRRQVDRDMKPAATDRPPPPPLPDPRTLTASSIQDGQKLIHEIAGQRRINYNAAATYAMAYPTIAEGKSRKCHSNRQLEQPAALYTTVRPPEALERILCNRDRTVYRCKQQFVNKIVNNRFVHNYYLRQWAAKQITGIS